MEVVVTTVKTTNSRKVAHGMTWFMDVDTRHGPGKIGIANRAKVNVYVKIRES